MTKTVDQENEDKKIDELRLIRTQTLIGVWDYITQQKIINPDFFKLSTPLVNEIIEHYLLDMQIMKLRYKIEDKIQLYKIAGLMTSLILRYRPIIPLIDEYKSENDIYANELFAVIYALSICSEYDINSIQIITKTDWFQPWLEDILFLLHQRNHTAESLIFIFETLSFFCFPKNTLMVRQKV